MAEWAKTAARLGAAYFSGGASEAALAAGEAGGGGGGAPMAPQSFDGRDVINIAPSASNAGEIIKQFYGSPENGGFGAPGGSRYIDGGGGVDALRAPSFDPEGSDFPWGIASAAVLAGTLAFVLLR